MSEIGLSGSRPRPSIGLAIGVAVAAVLLVAALVSIVWTADGAGHWLGTDGGGRGVMSAGMRALLASLLVPVASVIAGGLIGLPVGLAMARWRGSGRTVRTSSAALLLPALVVALLLAAIARPSELNAAIAIVLATVAPLAMATRDASRAVQRRPYLEAAHLAGLSRWEALRTHALREIALRIAATASRMMAAGIGIEAALGFAGLGMQPPGFSLGLLLRDSQGNAAATVVFGLLLCAAIAAFLLIARGISRPERAADAAA